MTEHSEGLTAQITLSIGTLTLFLLQLSETIFVYCYICINILKRRFGYRLLRVYGGEIPQA